MTKLFLQNNYYAAVLLICFLNLTLLGEDNKPASSEPTKANQQSEHSHINDKEFILSIINDINEANDPNDPNALIEPNEILAFEQLLHNIKSNQKASLQKPATYWQKRYHHQVTHHTFNVTQYPYHHQGIPYAQKNIIETMKPEESPETKQTPANQTDSKLSITDDSLDEWRFKLEIVYELIYKWRSLNESDKALIEIVRGIELTRTNTKIYRLNPKLAVEVKRTLGQISRANYKFDMISRLTISTILSGKPSQTLINLLDKQYTDLESLVSLIAEQNDEIGVVIGLGKFERNQVAPEYLHRLDYTEHLLPVTTADSPDTLMQK